MGILGAAIPSSSAFVCGKPQTNTTRLRMIQGSQAANIFDFGVPIADCVLQPVSLATTDSGVSWLPAPNSCLQILFGFHTFRNPASAASETNEAATSTNHGP